ncbi:MAG: peptidylprolyl isomerase [Nanoarchaeota archaeon]|nr:peptidylprolyl isomerase [Nanoarchaeota archaeon]
MIEKNDCVKLDYNAYVKENNQLFDTTKEEKAKSAGIYREGVKYEPETVIVGKKFIIPGVDDSLIGRKTGDSYKLTVVPEKAFGLRDPKFMQNIRISEFKQEKIDPVKGMIVNIDNQMGTVIFVSPGRFAKVDFNHPLSGKELVYEIKILEKVTSPEEIVKSATDKLLGKEGVNVEAGKENATIKTKQEVPKNLQEMVKNAVKESLKKGYTLTFIHD